MIKVSYVKHGILYDHLSFRHTRILHRWIAMLKADGATEVKVRWE